MSTPLLSIRGDDGQMHPVPILGGQVKVGATAGLPVFTGPGGVAEAKTAEAARAALGLPYEVGTWTPVKVGGTYNGEISSFDENRYLRLGRLLYVSCRLILSAAQTSYSHMYIHGLPFLLETSATGWTVISNNAYLGQGNVSGGSGALFFTNGVLSAGATVHYGAIGIIRS